MLKGNYSKERPSVIPSKNSAYHTLEVPNVMADKQPKIMNKKVVSIRLKDKQFV